MRVKMRTRGEYFLEFYVIQEAEGKEQIHLLIVKVSQLRI